MNMKPSYRYSQAKFWRITFTPAGAARKRTCWASKRRQTGNVVTYTVCKADGDEWHGRDGDTREIVVVYASEVVELPARLNLHYEELEVMGA